LAITSDDLFSHLSSAGDERWFDRFYFNLHSAEEEITLSQGMGLYPHAGVLDGFALLAERGRQRNVRLAREGLGSERRLEIGNLAAEIVEPGVHWRFHLADNEAGFSYDLDFEADLPAVDAGRIERVSRRTGAVVDMWHYAQPGRVRGTLLIDGTRREIAGGSWLGLRDRTWGIRPGAGDDPPTETPHPTLGRHDWAFGRMGDHSFLYFLAGGGSHGPHLLAARLSGPDGITDIEAVERILDWDSSGRFQGARSILRCDDGRTIEVHTSAPLATLYLRGGLYGGWQGKRHGTHRGFLSWESEEWDTADPAVLTEIAGLNDHIVRFESHLGTGTGIYEVASGI
jgi:hypothetical protein